MTGPIAPIHCFGPDACEILKRYVEARLIPSIVLDGILYVSFNGVFSDMLSAHIGCEYDNPAVWDGTYAAGWLARPQIAGRFVMPRGFKEPVLGDFLPQVSLFREMAYLNGDDGEQRQIMAAYPRHVADQAAEMFRALYRENGFIERFQQYNIVDPEHDSDGHYRVAPLNYFDAHEIELFKTFAGEGGIRLYMQDGEGYVREGDLMYYDIFAAKLVEDEFDTDFEMSPGMDREIEVRLDGTLTHGWPYQKRITLLRKQAGRADH